MARKVAHKVPKETDVYEFTFLNPFSLTHTFFPFIPPPFPPPLSQ